jgi:uncharacterized membrane protein
MEVIKMKSIKPGRGPSFMGGVGSIAAIIFGIFWTIMAASMGAPIFFLLFGVIFIALGLMLAVYHFKNATSNNRYSVFDITNSDEESDPLHARFSSKYNQKNEDVMDGQGKGNFCPYCGNKVEADHSFCK